VGDETRPVRRFLWALIERRNERGRILSRMVRRSEPFAVARALGLRLAGVEATTKYDGSPVLQVHGVFMAGLAMHPSAEPDTLVVRMNLDDRALLLDEAPEAYYVTPYYQPYPVVLVRLSRVDNAALSDLLSVSRGLALEKTAKRR
jgi:hypothetical protein